MEKNPLVSVIVPTYNSAKTLGPTLQSIVDQTFKDFEIIMIDGGSTDGTRSVADAFSDNVDLRWSPTESKGVADARNIGVKNSLGEYIAFCDSDDLWLPDKLEQQLAIFKPDTTLVFSDGYIFDDTTKPKDRFFYLMKPAKGHVYGDLVKGNFIATSSVIVRKSALTEPFSGEVCEDYRMWLSLARAGSFDFVPTPLIYYYEHNQGLSKNKVKIMLARIQIRKAELDGLRRNGPREKKLLSEVRFAIFKDTLLLTTLKVLPDRVRQAVNALYYRSRFARKVIKAMTGD